MARTLSLAVALLAYPFTVSAQAANPNVTIPQIFASLTQLFNRLIPFLVLVATAIFLWGIVRYITAGEDEEQVKEARRLIAYGVVVLAITITMWALVWVVVSAFLGSGTLPPIPGPNLDPFL